MKRKIIAYSLILIVLVGLFGYANKTHASVANPSETCQGDDPLHPTNAPCGQTPTSNQPDSTSSDDNVNALKDSLPDCGTLFEGTPEGCLIKISYYMFFALPAKILEITANLFNALLALSLGTTLYRNDFLPQAWGVIRDFSNIFFILVLLYIAIQTILGMGGHKVKEMIAHVILMAFLINFSFFFTEVVIDASNMLALIFYNKIEVSNADGTPRPYDANFNGEIAEKDFGGAIVSGFNPAALMNPAIFASYKIPVPNKSTLEKISCVAGKIASGPAGVVLGGPCFDSTTVKSGGTSFYLSIIFVSCLIFLFAAYAFLVAALAFFGRLIELWVLIIFSPFAFMSYSVPFLEKIDDLGWDKWFHKLISTAFMAPIFMVFMYLISQIVTLASNDIFSQSEGTSTTARILGIVIPAIIDLTLLMMAVKIAQKSGGRFGDIAVAGAKMVGGLAVGAASGGTAMVARASVGRLGDMAANSTWAKEREAQGKLGSALFRDVTKKVGSSSFDLRGAKIAGKSLGGVTGLTVGDAQKGGFAGSRKEQVRKRQERAKDLEVGEDEELKQNLNKTEENLHDLLSKNAEELEAIDKVIEKKRQEVVDAQAKFNSAKGTPEAADAKILLDNAIRERDNAKRKKTALREGKDYAGDVMGDGTTDASTGKEYSKTATIGGISIEKLEKEKKDRTQAIKDRNRHRRHEYAHTTEGWWEQTKGFVLSGGQHSFAGAREAAHKIRMEIKPDKGGGDHGKKDDHDHAPAAKATPAKATPAADHGHDDHKGGDHH